MRKHVCFAVCTALLAIVAAACGSGGSGSSSTNPPSTGGGGGTTTTDPCSTAITADSAEAGPPSLLALGAQPVSDKKTLVDGDPRGRLGEALWLHRAGAERERTASGTPSPIAQDVGDIAVVQDQGDIVLPANVFDLGGSTLRFTRSGSGYAVTKGALAYRPTLGRQLTLADDDSVEMDVPFSFPFYTVTQRVA
jgi:hypothetical protein